MSRARRLAYLAFAFSLAACTPSPRDVVPESRDVHVVPDVRATEHDAYAYVARRAHGVVALAEARHLPDDVASGLVERLADELERCAAQLEAQQLLVEGAARIVALAGPDGTPALQVRLAPGDAVAQNALLCLVAPVRAMALPPPTAGRTPGYAIEATWTPRTSRAEGRGRESDVRESGTTDASTWP